MSGKPARLLADDCRRLRDVLGEHQDSVLAQAWLREVMATASSREAFVAGQLSMLERGVASAARAAWPKDWRRVARKRRRWLKA